MVVSVRFFALLLVVCALCSCGRSVPHDLMIPAAESYAPDLKAYTLGVGDELLINVYQEQDLSGSYEIASDGTISMALIGNIDVIGLTAADLEELLRAHYADGYLIDPSIQVQIKEYRPFYIMGEVQRPGQYSYVNHMSVLNAVALAEGFTYRADRDVVKILRGADAEEGLHDYRYIHPQGLVMPGDVLIVEERVF